MSLSTTDLTWNPAVDGPHFIVIGAQKAGSSYVQDSLRAHPQVYMPRGESPFFEHPDAVDNLHLLAQLVRGRESSQISGLKRPDYLPHAQCAARIAEVLPHVKLIAVLRNPVDRAISAYHHHMLHGLLPLEDPEHGLRNLLNGDTDPRYPRGREILEYGFYARHLDRYYQHFSPSQVHLIVYDDLKAHPAVIIDDVCRFLGIDAPSPLTIRSANPTIYSLRRIALIRRLATFGVSEDLIGRRSGRRLPGVTRLLHELLTPRASPQPRLSHALLSDLRAVYASDITRLRNTYGLNVGGW